MSNFYSNFIVHNRESGGQRILTAFRESYNAMMQTTRDKQKQHMWK